MNRSQTFRKYLAQTAIAGVLVVGAGVFGFQGPQNAPLVDALSAPYGAGGEYHAITPIRILDTRKPVSDVAPFGRKQSTAPAGPEFLIPALGAGQIPAFVDANGDGLDDNVLALAVNVTVAGPSAGGQVKLYAAGAANVGESSLANFDPRRDVPNFAIVRPGQGGKLAARINSVPAGDADLIIDVFGYFTTSNAKTRGARLITTEPQRVYNSRLPGLGAARAGKGNEVKVPIRGAVALETGGVVVPNDPSIVAAVVNITSVNATTYTYVSALPTPVPAALGEPETSNINVRDGEQRAATAIVPIGPDGSIYLYNAQGTVDLIVDVVGYMQTGAAESTTTGRVIPLTAPYRAGDTREAVHFNHPIGPGQAEDWSFEKFVADVKINGEWVGAQQGFIANFTATQLTRQYPTLQEMSFLAMSPPPANGVGREPSTSSVNFPEGKDVPNMVIARYGTNSADARCAAAHCVRVFNSRGNVGYVMDISAVILA